jgi:hypothetical protein
MDNVTPRARGASRHCVLCGGIANVPRTPYREVANALVLMRAPSRHGATAGDDEQRLLKRTHQRLAAGARA